MEKPEKPTPHIPYDLVEGGDRSTPVLTSLTHGGKSNARIFHTAENGLNFEYRQQNVNKKSVHLFCIYAMLAGVKCKAKMVVTPKAPNLIVKKKNQKGRVGFHINHEAPLNVNDWLVKKIQELVSTASTAVTRL